MTVQDTGLQIEDEPDGEAPDDDAPVVAALDRIQEILTEIGFFLTSGKRLTAWVKLALLLSEERTRVAEGAQTLLQRVSTEVETGVQQVIDTSLEEIRVAQAEAARWKQVANAATMYLPEPERTSVRLRHGLDAVPNFGGVEGEDA